MKEKYKLLSTAMVLAFSVYLFTGCGKNDADAQATDDDSVQDSSITLESYADDGSTDNIITEDIIGEIATLSSFSMTLEVYEADTEIYDYTALDTSTLMSTGDAETVSIDADAEYYYISAGSLVSQAANDLSVGDLIAITTDDGGSQQVILLVQQMGDYADDTNDTDDANDTDDTAEDF